VIAQVHAALASQGFSVARNAPYAGGYTTKLYGKPEAKVHALQIEVSRALYLDETTMEKNPDFAQAKDRLRRFARALTAKSWTDQSRRQAAAE
jgi:N-formylglutamate amidohydrolase